MLLREIAHARAGDKGNLLMISVIAYDNNNFTLLEERLTAARVEVHFAQIIDRPVRRYVLPHLAALNFVLHRPDAQSVTRSLALDTHGKCLAATLLGIEI